MKTLTVNRKGIVSILTLILVFISTFVVGCGEADDDTESENASEVILPTASKANETSAGIVEEPVEEPAAANLCKVGDVLSPGDSCIDHGPGDEFRVLDNGSGQYLFITAGKGIDLQGNINGKPRNFKAERIEGDKWEIISVTRK